MDSRAKLIATLSAFALFCLLIAFLPIGADTSDRNRTTHDEIDAACLEHFRANLLFGDGQGERPHA
jgi:hypothetical protein